MRNIFKYIGRIIGDVFFAPIYIVEGIMDAIDKWIDHD